MSSKRWSELGSGVFFLCVLLGTLGAYHSRRSQDHSLSRALDTGQWRRVSSLVHSGADPRRAGEFGRTALDVALSHDDPDLLRVVLKRAPDLTPHSEVRTTSLIRAAESGSQGCVRALLDAGSAVDEGDSRQGTALMAAATYNRLDTLRLLLERGAAVEAQDAEGNTALMCAAYGWHPEAVELLLAAGADPQAYNRYGQTALTLARTYHSDDHDLPTPAEKLAQRRILTLLRPARLSRPGVKTTLTLGDK